MTGHLIHIGYPKTGSNLLRRWFAMHPQLGYAEGGIAGFHRIYELVQLAAAPRRDILWRVSSSEGLATPHAFIGAPLVDYESLSAADLPAAQARTCRILADLFGDARILIVTRGFRAMLVSTFSQYVRSGGERDFSGFLDFWRGQGEAASAIWDYDHLIGLYEQAFPGCVVVMPYELLRDDPDAFVRRLEATLGLDHAPLPAGRVNEALSDGEMRLYPRAARWLSRLPGGRTHILPRLLRGSGSVRRRRLFGMIGSKAAGAPQPEDIPDALVEPFRGRAERLRTDPAYGPYGAEYLL